GGKLKFVVGWSKVPVATPEKWQSPVESGSGFSVMRRYPIAIGREKVCRSVTPLSLTEITCALIPGLVLSESCEFSSSNFLLSASSSDFRSFDDDLVDSGVPLFSTFVVAPETTSPPCDAAFCCTPFCAVSCAANDAPIPAWVLKE